MTYSLRQVQPLLTKPELELFQASRAGAIKELNPRQLAAKLTRARALRDKYRDTYRRQTVATRTGPAKDRKQMGGENNRTEVKAEIMQEVLTRFEAQHAKAQAKLDKQAARKTKTARAHNAPGAPTTRTNPKAAQRSRRSTGNAAPGEGAQLAMRGATTTKPRQVARKKRAAEDLGYEVVSARGAKSTRAGGSSVRPAVKKAAAKKAEPKKTTAKKAPAKKIAAKKAITGAAKPAEKLVKQVRKAVANKAATAPTEGQPTARRAIRTQVGGTSSANAQGAVPTNMPAKAQRLNPLKAEPINKKIHASARGRKKTFEGKRDAR
ncbi:hypothetical protein H0I39_16890 [Ottowia beijingensis]|uniref:Uncharacterized protein n=1 Tax=Ottowia beijingensis TaxID=1207057 RepID=A0A853IQX0_9BURK|nr:hypothetical protein [Ottowia beijingensis]NZA02983.1 hypothetical protein [Ottowia beijingensis]